MNRAIFIDRDGTLNEEVGYIDRPAHLRLFPFAAEAVRRINAAGWRAILVTNQSGVARGYLSEAQLAALHVHLAAALAGEGARLDAIHYCPHHPTEGESPYRQDCECRKPKPGLLTRAAQDFDLDLAQSFVVGDRYRDVEMAHRAGASGVLVLTGYGRDEYEHERASWTKAPEHVAENLLEAVKWILKEDSGFGIQGEGGVRRCP
jgi:D-glycero-D-manno-heptose 1,7-bisphosphate phosphatase